MSSSLQHLGGDRWRVRMYAGLNQNGKPRQVSRTFRADGERAAKRAAEQVTAQLRTELAEQARHAGTVAGLADEWLALKRRTGRSPVTIDGYERIIDVICNRFGAVPLDHITGRDIDRWYGELTDTGASSTTIAHYHSVLRAMFAQAVKWDQIVSSPVTKATSPKAPRREVRPPTPAALAAALIDEPPSDFRSMVELAALTGMRRGELCGLWWSDLDGDAATVRRAVVETPGGHWEWKLPKTNQIRRLVLGPTATAVLAEQHERLTRHADRIGFQLTPNTPVFADLRVDVTGHTPRKPSWLSHRFGKFRNARGLTGARFHDLRHLNATALLQAGVPVRSVSARAGHSKTSTTTDIYSHDTDAGAALAVQAVEGEIARQLRP